MQLTFVNSGFSTLTIVKPMLWWSWQFEDNTRIGTSLASQFEERFKFFAIDLGQS